MSVDANEAEGGFHVGAGTNDSLMCDGLLCRFSHAGPVGRVSFGSPVHPVRNVDGPSVVVSSAGHHEGHFW